MEETEVVRRLYKLKEDRNNWVYNGSWSSKKDLKYLKGTIVEVKKVYMDQYIVEQDVFFTKDELIPVTL